MSTTIDIQLNTNDSLPPAVNETTIISWISPILSEHHANGELAINFITEEEMQALNYTYRGKNNPTNVLAFPADVPELQGFELQLLGDIAICLSVIQKEAEEQGKTYANHLTHIVIHGTLHILGYDHINEPDEIIMQQKEIEYLRALNIDNPY